MFAAAALNWKGCRRQVLRGYLYDLVGREAQGVATEADGHWLFMPTRDYVGRETFMFSGFEEDVMAEALHLAELKSGRSVKGRTFVDVGANIGTTTVAALTLFGASAVVAVEPGDENVRFLRVNVAANDLQDRVRVVHAALSDRPGIALLELSSDNSGDHRVRLSTAPGALAEEGRRTVEAATTTFDDLGLDLDDVGVVWVDVQGHEAHVLSGANKLLESDVPVILEYMPYALRRASALDVLHDIIARHYTHVVDVRAGRTLPAANVATLASRYGGSTYTDLVLIPKNR